MHLAVLTTDAVSALGSSFQGAVVGIAARAGAFLQERAAEPTGMSPDKWCTDTDVQNAARRSKGNLLVATVTFLSVLQVAIATALPAVHDSGVGHVEETLSPSRPQVAPQLPQVAVVKHPREWMAKDQDKKCNLYK